MVDYRIHRCLHGTLISAPADRDAVSHRSARHTRLGLSTPGETRRIKRLKPGWETRIRNRLPWFDAKRYYARPDRQSVIFFIIDRRA
jgi:hypothetical protein